MNFEQLKPALEAANHNLNALQTLLNAKFGLNFSGKSCPANKSVKIWETQKNGFILKDFGNSYATISNKNFNGIVYALGLKPAEITQILSAAGISPNSTTANHRDNVAAPTAKTAFSVCSWKTAVGQKALAYLALKTGADLQTLERHDVQPVDSFTGAAGRKFISTPTLFKVAYSSEKGAKLVQINNGKKDENHTYTTVLSAENARVFGLSFLPATGENLIICEGENDCICLNYFGQSLNTYAVTFGSANNTNVPADVIENLKSRFKKVFILFDSQDVEKKSLANARAISDKHNLIRLDFDFIALHLLNCGLFAPSQSSKLILAAKDVCSVFGIFGANAINQFIKVAVGAAGLVAANNADKFSISFNDCLAFDFGQHISGANSVADAILQPLDTIVTALIKYKKVVLQSAAGTGKSYALAGLIDKILNTDGFFQSLCAGIDKVIICLPTLPLSEQLLKDMQAKRPNTLLIKGGTDAVELEAAINGTNVILCTYDSSIKLLLAAQNCLFVIDEYHQLPSEIGYRSKAMQAVKVFLDNAPFTLFLSATPSYLFAKSLGAKLILGRPTITNNILLSVFTYTPKPNINNGLFLLDCLIHKFLAARAAGELPKDTAALVKLDSSTTLEAAAEYVNNLGLGLVSRCLYSGENEVRKGTNKLLNDIQDSSTFGGENIDVLFVTRFLEAGVSIKENLCVINLDTKEPSKIIQFFSRPRLDLARGINQNVWAWCCVADAKKAAALPTDFNLYSEFLQRENAARAKAENANLHHKKLSVAEQIQHIYTVENDNDFNLYFDESKDCFNVNTIRIISILETEAMQGQNADLLLSRISVLDNRVRLVCTENLQPKRLDKAHALRISLSAKKTENKELEADFNSLFLADANPEKLLIYLTIKSKSKTLKEVLASALGINLRDEKFSANAYFSALSDDYQSIIRGLKVSKTDKKLEDIAFYLNQKYTLANAVIAVFAGSPTQIAADKLTAQQIKTGERLAQNSTIAGRGKLSALQLANAAFDAGIKNAFAQKRKHLAQRPNEKPITLPYILSVVNAVGAAHTVGRKKTEKDCIEIIKRLYNVETKRIRENGKRLTIYVLGELK